MNLIKHILEAIEHVCEICGEGPFKNHLELTRHKVLMDFPPEQIGSIMKSARLANFTDDEMKWFSDQIKKHMLHNHPKKDNDEPN
jgi:hypothetical protein